MRNSSGPGPAAAHRHRARSRRRPVNFARNSSAACSNIEFISLELQRFRAVSKSDRGKLCATFAGVVIALTLGSLCRSRALWPGSAVAHAIAISHVIPQQLVQTLNLYRWNCNVFGRSRKMTVGNYVRNLSGGGPANPCWPYQPAAACTTASPFGSSGAFRTGRVVLSWLAPTLPRVRYKILPAWLLGGENGTKLSLHAE